MRQETVQVILGEQKLQVEHRLLKNELDELTKVRCQGHMNAYIHVPVSLRRLEINICKIIDLSKIFLFFENIVMNFSSYILSTIIL